MDESEIEANYRKTVEHLSKTPERAAVYYPKTNFINMIRQMSSIYSPYQIERYLSKFKNWYDVKFESDVIDKLVYNTLIPEPNKEIRNIMSKPWCDMNRYEKKLILNFFNIKPNNSINSKIFEDYGYFIYLSLQSPYEFSLNIMTYYSQHIESRSSDYESKLSDYDLNSQKEFIMNLLSEKQKIKLLVKCELPSYEYPKNLSVSELQKLFINYKMIKNFKLNEKTKIIIALNNSIEDVKKMVEEENNVGTKVVGETHV